jgi:hypothetical protein
VADTVIFNGTAGTFHENTSEYVQYQFIASLFNTCGVCLSYHMAIKRGPWFIPIHFGCNCKQALLKPGATAPNAFVDFREILDQMPHSQQVAAIGASNYKLLKNGVIEWKDVVTPLRVRPLREVVALKKLSIKSMVDVGVRPSIAQTAHASVHTAEHELIAQQRKELVDNLKGAGLSHEQLVDQLAKGLASRVSIGAGPDTYGLGPAWKGGPVAPFDFGSGSNAARLAMLLSPRRLTGPAPKKRPLEQARDDQRAQNQADAVKQPVVVMHPTTDDDIRRYEGYLGDAKKEASERERKLLEGAADWGRIKVEDEKYKNKMFDYSIGRDARKRWEKKLDDLRKSPEYDRLLNDVKYAPDRIRYAKENVARYQKLIDDKRALLQPVKIEYAKNVGAHPDLIAPGPIEHRVARYKVGDAKVKSLVELDSTYTHQEAGLASDRVRLSKEIDAANLRFAELHGLPTRTDAERLETQRLELELESKNRQHGAVKAQQKALSAQRRADAMKILEIDKADRVAFGHQSADAGAASGAGALKPLGTFDKKRADEAVNWLSRVVAKGDGEFADAMSLKIGEAPGVRAHWSSNKAADKYNIQVKTGESVDVIVHEYGHAIDGGVKIGDDLVLKRSLEFLEHRLKGEQPVELKSMFSWFDPGEKGAKDEFDKVFDGSSAYYVGKDYGRAATEVVSMGLQQMYNDPVKFAQRDPEYAKFIMGIMDGSLR